MDGFTVSWGKVSERVAGTQAPEREQAPVQEPKQAQELEQTQ